MVSYLLIRNKSRKAHRDLFEKSYFEHADESYRNPTIEYIFDTKHLIVITDYDLEYFEKNADSYGNAFNALDNLYSYKGIDLEWGIIND